MTRTVIDCDRMHAEAIDEAWETIHRDFRTIINGVRFVCALDPKTGATVLRPWRGEPKK